MTCWCNQGSSPVPQTQSSGCLAQAHSISLGLLKFISLPSFLFPFSFFFFLIIISFWRHPYFALWLLLSLRLQQILKERREQKLANEKKVNLVKQSFCCEQLVQSIDLLNFLSFHFQPVIYHNRLTILVLCVADKWQGEKKSAKKRNLFQILQADITRNV